MSEIRVPRNLGRLKVGDVFEFQKPEPNYSLQQGRHIITDMNRYGWISHTQEETGKGLFSSSNLEVWQILPLAGWEVNKKEQIMANEVSTTLGELAKGDEFKLGYSHVEVFVKVADHLSTKNLHNHDCHLVEAKASDDRSKRFFGMSGQLVVKLVKPLTLGELKPGEKLVFKNLYDGKVFTKLDGVYAYAHQTHTYVMDDKYVVYNFQTEVEVERLPF